MQPTDTPQPTVVWATPTLYPASSSHAEIDLDVASNNFYTIAEHGVQIYQTTNQFGAIDNMLWAVIAAICFIGFKNIRKRIRDL